MNTPEPSWVRVAKSLYGLRERSKGDAGAIQLMYQDVGSPEITRDEVPWCAAFVGSCLARAGYKHSGSLLAKSYLDYGVQSADPEVGAIAVFDRGSDPSAGHVGFVLSWTDQHVRILGGNQSNAVNVQVFDRDKVLDYRLPGSFQHDMTVDRFGHALSFVREAEGGWSDRATDHPTMYGIILSTYRAWRKRWHNEDGITKSDLKRIEWEEAAEIYETDYWLGSHADRLPAGLGLLVFDMAVNAGQSRAIKLLQQALGMVEDGELGPITLASVHRTNPRTLIRAYTNYRRAFYRSLSKFDEYGRGWFRRADEAEKLALSIADQNPVKKPTTTIEKENPDMAEDTLTSSVGQDDGTTGTDIPQSKPKSWAASKTIWGIITVFATNVLPLLLSFYGINISGEAITELSNQAYQITQLIGGLIGTILALYGRADAKQSLTHATVRL